MSRDTSGEGVHSDLNRAELDAMERMIRRANGFRLGLAIVNHPDLRERLISTLRDDLSSDQVATIDVDPSSETGIVGAIEDAASRDAAVILVSGLERLQDLPAEIAVLNLNRDYLNRAVNCPVIFWLPEFALRAFAHTAADLWSARSGLYRFVPEGEDARGTAALASDRISWATPLEERVDWEELLQDVIDELAENDDLAAQARAVAGLGESALMRSMLADGSDLLERALFLYREI
ncbi:MAG TPA: hypothetical protein VFJ65_07180, partial [Solirubrobacterales bacterium]|nr:hypothetical protein [Solirubrobacterales bacterium]